MQESLNPKIWADSKLLPEVREKLMAIATKFVVSLEIGQQPADIIFTGSMASYAWTDKSDIDLHVLLDYKQIDGGGKLVKDFLMAKKGLWNDKHHITIKGFPVELYAQDTHEPHYAQGIYSVLNDKWVKEPIKEAPQVVDQVQVDKKAEYLMFEIDTAIEAKDLDKLGQISLKLRDMRSAGLAQEGEYSVENQVFKKLRRNNYLEKLAQAKLEISDQMMSLNNKEHKMEKQEVKKTAESDVRNFGQLVVAPGRFVTTEQGDIVVQVPSTSQYKNAAFHPAEADRYVHFLATLLSNQDFDLGTVEDAKTISDESMGKMGAEASKKTTADYQGWKNYESWAVALWLDNDQGMQEMVREWATEAVSGAGNASQVKDGIWTAPEAAKYALADQIKDYIEEGNPVTEASLYSDLMNAALSEVDWAEVAEHFMDESAEAGSEVKEGSLMAAIDSMGKTAAPKKKTKKPMPKSKAPKAPVAPATTPVAPAAPAPVEFDEDTVKAEMATALKTDAESVEVEKGYSDDSLKVTADGVEYEVMTGEDAAEAKALAQVRDDLTNEPEIFNQEWLRSHIKLGDTDCRLMAQDLVGDYYTEMKDSEVEEEYEREIGEIEHPEASPLRKAEEEAFSAYRQAEEGEEKARLMDIWVKADDAAEADEKERGVSQELDYDKFREELESKKSEEYEKALQEDPFQFLVKDQGVYSAEDFFKQFGHNIDIDEAAQDAVNTDGWAHFISRYDGNYDTTPAGFVYWREN